MGTSSTGESVAAIWRRVEQALAATSPEALAGLRPGASKAQIAALEQELGAALPEDVRQSYLVHDGQEGGSDSICDHWVVMPLDEALRKWRMLNELRANGEFADTKPEVSPLHQPEWWSGGWFPLVRDGAGNYYCVDLAPGPEGVIGQILLHDHEDAARPVVAANFCDWLTSVAVEREEEIADARLLSGEQKASAGPSMKELLELVGRAREDQVVKRFLAAYPITRHKDEKQLTYDCWSLGFDLVCEHGAIVQIDVYFKATERVNVFAGELLFNISPGDSAVEIRAKLGTPVASSPKGFYDAFHIEETKFLVQYDHETKRVATIIMVPWQK